MLKSLILTSVLVVTTQLTYAMTCEVQNENRYVKAENGMFSAEVIVKPTSIDLENSAYGNKRLATLCVTQSVAGMQNTEVKVDQVDSVSNAICQNLGIELTLDNSNKTAISLQTNTIRTEENIKLENKLRSINLSLPFSSEIEIDIKNTESNFPTKKKIQLNVKCY